MDVNEIKQNAIKYYGNELAADVWMKKYALKDGEEFIETSPKQTYERIINELYKVEKEYKDGYSKELIEFYLKEFKYFIPGGSVLFGAGNDYTVSSLGNCFFLDNKSDSYGGIFDLDQSMVQLMKRRGGVGLTLEHLRPSGAKVNNAASTSTGAVSFMERFSNSTREVAQDGRRGALMLSLDINHPNVKDFITKKDDRTSVTGANVSVKVNDKFMKAVSRNEDYILHWPTDKELDDHVSNEKYVYDKLYKLEDGTYIKRVKAKEVWDLIIKMAHKNAEPGVLFWDNVIIESPADCYKEEGFKSNGVNPCGEVVLSSHDSCRLGSIVLSEVVKFPYTKEAYIDYDLLAKVTRASQRFMDDFVTLEEYKIIEIINKIKDDPEDIRIKRPELELWEKVLEVAKKGRRTGLGVVGLGDMLAKLNIKYASDDCLSVVDNVFKTIAVNSYLESVNLAKTRGAFPIWNLEKEQSNPFIIRTISNNFGTKDYNNYCEYGRRNIANLSIAPTGTLSILLGVTSGIEPVIKCYYKRRRKINPNENGVRVDFVDEVGDSWQEYPVFHQEMINWMKTLEQYKQYDTTELLSILEKYSNEELDNLVKISPWGESESHNINYLNKVKMQGIIQKWIDHSISVTHNLPKDVSLEEVNDIYFYAWKHDCKGCTIYRDGSRSGVLITSEENKEKEDDFKETHAPKRPKELPADYYVVTANGIKYAVIIGLYKKKPYEIFAFENPPMLKNTKGKIIKVKKGQYKFINGEFEIEDVQLAANRVEQRAHTILLSMLLRHRAPIEHVLNVAKKIDDNISSFSSACRRILSRYSEKEISYEKCPECGDTKGGKLIREEGCLHCDTCSYSRC